MERLNDTYKMMRILGYSLMIERSVQRARLVVVATTLALVLAVFISTFPAQAQQPSVEILEPQNRATIASPVVVISFQISGAFELHPPGEPADEEGHIHFMVDGGLPELYVSDQPRSLTFTPGSHDVIVELVQNNHMSLDPRVMDQVSFTVTLTSEGQMVLERVDTLTTLMYAVLGLTTIAVILAAVAIIRGGRRGGA